MEEFPLPCLITRGYRYRQSYWDSKTHHGGMKEHTIQWTGCQSNRAYIHHGQHRQISLFSRPTWELYHHDMIKGPLRDLNGTTLPPLKPYFDVLLPNLCKLVYNPTQPYFLPLTQHLTYVCIFVDGCTLYFRSAIKGQPRYEVSALMHLLCPNTIAIAKGSISIQQWVINGSLIGHSWKIFIFFSRRVCCYKQWEPLDK